MLKRIRFTRFAKVFGGYRLPSLVAALALLSSVDLHAADVQINNATIKTIDEERRYIGENTTWLYSSDDNFGISRNVEMKDVYESMNLGFARFPYGALAQNYRWHTPTWDSATQSYDYSDAVDGLVPRVSTMASIPGQWPWHTNADGTMPEAMDFDEFIQTCQYAGMEPIVVINIDGYHAMANDDPMISQLGMPHKMTRAEMIAEAAAWVNYANNVRGYGVKYWAIGNEVEGKHTQEVYPTASDYVDVFKDVAQAMKAVDSSILIAPGTFQNSQNYLDDLYADSVARSYIDVVLVHQYLFSTTAREWGTRYVDWSNSEGYTLNPKIANVNNWVNDPDPMTTDDWGGEVPEVLVTECGVTGIDWPEDVTTAFRGMRFEKKQTGGQYLYMMANGEARVSYNNPILDEAVMHMEAIDGEMGYVRIKAISGSSSQYLRASGSGGTVDFDGDGLTDSCKWERIGGLGDPCYFENKAYPDEYLALANGSNELVLKSGILFDGTNRIYLDNRIKTASEEAQIQLTGSNFWGKTRNLRNYHSSRLMNVVSSTDEIRGTVLRALDTNDYLFTMEDAVGGLDGDVRLLSESTGNYVQISEPSPGEFRITADGSGTDNASTWIYHYEDTNAAGEEVKWSYRLESKAFPGQYLMYEDDDSSSYYTFLTGGGAGSEDTSIFSMPNAPSYAENNTWAPKPTSTDDKERMRADLWKGLLWADMILETFEYENVGSMVHWNTQSTWSGELPSWYLQSDSIEPSADAGLTTIGQTQTLISRYATGRVLELADFSPSASLRVYACLDDERGQMKVFVLNKSSSSQTLGLSFGNSFFDPTNSGYYDSHTFKSSTSDPEDVDPIHEDIFGVSYPTSGDFTIPALCLQVLVLNDPSIATGPVDREVTMNSLASYGSISAGDLWLEAEGNDVGASEPHAFGSSKYLDLTNVLRLTQYDSAIPDSYQLSPLVDSAEFFRYVSANQNAGLTLDGSAGVMDSEWSWNESWSSGLNASYTRLPTSYAPSRSMRVKASSAPVNGVYGVDSAGGAGSWAQYVWEDAPLAPLGQSVMIRSLSTGNLLFSSKTGSRNAWLGDLWEEPEEVSGSYNHPWVFHVESVSGQDGYVTLKSDLSGSRYLEAGATASDRVSVNGDGTSDGSYWKPLFKIGEKTVVFQSKSTGGFLRLDVDGWRVTTDTTDPTIDDAVFYWVVVP